MSTNSTQGRFPSTIKWPEPIPLEIEELENPVFPVNALGEIMGPAAVELSWTIQAPLFLACQSILANAALVTQGIANVAIDGRSYPLSLYLLSIAESGERKSAIDKVAGRPCEQWEQDQFEEYLKAKQEHQCALKARTIAEKALVKKLQGDPVKLKKALGELEFLSMVPVPRLFAPDPTLEGIHAQFREGIPILGLFSDEGGQFFGGHGLQPENALKTISGLSKLWDGSPIRRVRAGKNESYTGFNKRLSLHLMAQPQIVQPILASELFWQQGVLARFLPALGDSLFGLREYRESNPYEAPGVRRYHKCLERLLARINASPDAALPNLPLDNDARKKWVEIHNQIETKLSDSGTLFEIRSVGAKLAEQVLRLSGVMTLVEGKQTIGLRQVTNAEQLVGYYSEVWQLIKSKSRQDTNMYRANDLLNWIRQRGCTHVSTREIAQFGPGPAHLRTAQNVRKDMLILTNHHWARVAKTKGNKAPTEWWINPI